MTDPNQPPPGPIGILLIDKAIGRTSMDVCRDVRARLVRAGAPKRVKVGHGGTLDPLATGVVVVLVGKATRLVERVMDGAKRYTAEIDLAHVTPSNDLETPPTLVEVEKRPSLDDIDAACARFIGAIDQVPPAFSALKIDGTRAYQLARTGEPPPMEPRGVRIDSIDVIDYLWPTLTIDVRCGKGTYLRSLARDIGEALGTGGCLTGLRRTEVAPFTIDRCVTVDELPDELTQADLLDATL